MNVAPSNPRPHNRSRSLSREQDSEIETRQLDEEAPLLSENGPPNTDRFSYHPRTCLHRLASGTVLKSKLRTSEVVTISYSHCLKYILIAALTLSATLFSPSFLPAWLNLPTDWHAICPSSETQATNYKRQVETIMNLPELRKQAALYQHEVTCFKRAAEAYYQRPDRMQWPDECTPAKASEMLRSEVCVGPLTYSSCSELNVAKKAIGSITGFCKDVVVPKECKTVNDGKRTLELLRLEREHVDKINFNIDDSINSETKAIVMSKGSQIFNRLTSQADMASNLYIVYSIIGLMVGTPLILYKRGKTSRVIDVVFGIRKGLFILLVVSFLTVYDIISIVNIHFDFIKLWNDPCSVLDVKEDIIKSTIAISSCSEISKLAIDSSRNLQRMDDIYFLTRRFALCEEPEDRHPRDEEMQVIRQRFREGDLKFDGKCNASYLVNQVDIDINAAEERKEFFYLTFAGLVAQVFLKVVFSSWVLHFLAVIDPMILHAGRIEIWDATTTSRDDKSSSAHRIKPLNRREEKSARWFARDSHLLPFFGLSCTVIAQIILIIMGSAVSSLIPPVSIPMDASSTRLNVGNLGGSLQYNFQCLIKNS